MPQNLVKTNIPGYLKDMDTNLIINKDEDSYQSYIKSKQKSLKVKQLESEIKHIKDEFSLMKKEFEKLLLKSNITTDN